MTGATALLPIPKGQHQPDAAFEETRAGTG
jgi:hypothetical protein